MIDIDKIMREFKGVKEKISYWGNELSTALKQRDDLYSTLKGTRWSEPVSANKQNSDPTGDKVITIPTILKKYEDYIQYSTEKLNYYLSLKINIEKAFNEMDIDEMEVIEQRYFLKVNMREIPRIMGISRSTVWNYYNSAIKKIRQNLYVI